MRIFRNFLKNATNSHSTSRRTVYREVPDNIAPDIFRYTTWYQHVHRGGKNLFRISDQHRTRKNIKETTIRYDTTTGVFHLGVGHRKGPVSKTRVSGDGLNLGYLLLHSWSDATACLRIILQLPSILLVFRPYLIDPVSIRIKIIIRLFEIDFSDQYQTYR